MPDAAIAATPDAVVMGVSILVPAPFGEQLQQRRAAFGDPLAQAIPTHVTLLGPTPVAPIDLPELLDHLELAARSTEPFTMVLRGTGTFRPVSDVVFVQVARGISGCEGLESRIRSGRWSRDSAFPYHPHVTVAHDVDDASLDRAFDDLAGYDATFDVHSFHLYAKDDKGTWTPAREFRLRERPRP